jgi:sugar lactone lactonase YvrE
MAVSTIMKRFKVLGAALACISVALLFAQEIANTPEALSAAAIKAYQAKDYAGFLAFEKRALALEPDSPRILYNLACGEALERHAAEAVKMLDQLLVRKLDLGAGTDDDFASIRKSSEWAGFETRLAALRKPLVHSQVAFTLLEPELVAVGIAVDAKTGDTYISSVRERKILRRTVSMTNDFVAEGQDGFLAGASLAIDSGRRILYASTSAVPFMRGYREEYEGRSGLFAFDLQSGKLLRKAMLASDGKPHFLNALAVDRAGSVYVSDSGTAGIYCLKRGSDNLESVIPAGLFRSTQGLAFSADEKTLYVADYTDGLWAFDMATRRRRRVEAPADVWLGGMDGLTPVAGGFLTVQIGVQPERVLRLKLDAGGERIASVKILEMNHPDYAGPIQRVVSGNAFVYIANSQLALGNGQTGAFASERAKATVVLRLPL